jgi:hypothetical protein
VTALQRRGASWLTSNLNWDFLGIFWPLIKSDAYGSSIMEFFGNLIVFFMFACVVYGIILFCIPFILCAIMGNTKRSADLLAQILLVQTKTFKEPNSDPSSIDSSPALPTRTLSSIRVEKPASALPGKGHKEPAEESYNFTTQKWESTHNETDRK